MNPPEVEPVESLVHVPPSHNTTALLSSAWTAREYNGKHASQKRRACNECRQQKLRCDLANDQESTVTTCSRCVKLGLACKVDDTFQRTRKRKRSADFQDEIADLRRQLLYYQHQTHLPQGSPRYRPGDETPDRSAPGRISGSPINARLPGTDSQRTPSLINNGLLPPSEPNGTSPGTSIDQHETAGAGTRPHEHEIQAPATPYAAIKSRPRSLGYSNVTLSEEAIEMLYTIFFERYHPVLPILDASISAQQYCEMSPLLFWCMMAVAARRLDEYSNLISELSQPVTDLLWKAIRSVPHSPALVQSILLICAWPFPTSSTSTDPSYVLAHTAVSAAVQIGLHRPHHQQDFAKYRLNLTDKDIAARINLWTICNIVANSVSIGVGLQSPAHLRNWPNLTEPLPKSATPLAPIIENQLRVEFFRDKVTMALTNNATSESPTKPTEERLPLYKILNLDWTVLESSAGKVDGMMRFHILAARLHLHLFYLFDSPTSHEYPERILQLVSSATSLIQHVLTTDASSSTNTPLTPYCPFFDYQIFTAAAFVLLKVLRSAYYTDILGPPTVETARNLLETSIVVTRGMSVVKNDLALRTSDVLACLYNHPNPLVVCGEGVDALRLSVRSRLSMSILYDTLWRWRDHHRSLAAAADGTGPQIDDAEFQAALQELPAWFQFDEQDGFPNDDLYFDWFR